MAEETSLMVQATIRMKMSPGKTKEALEALRSLAERTSVEPGCAGCHVYYDALQDDTIMMEELWRDQEDLHQHLCSSNYQRVLLVVEMAEGKPEISFNTFSQSTGLETIVEARSSAQRTRIITGPPK
jgi:quinol monooxygenase YgiN